MEIIYNLNDKFNSCYLGHKYEHKANIVTFTGYTKDKPTNSLYLIIWQDEENNENTTQIILTDYSWEITQPITLKEGKFKAQLQEFDIDEEFIKCSDMFNVIIDDSLKQGEEYELKDPILDLEYAKMQKLYNTVQQKLYGGELKGEKGDKGDKGDSAYQVALDNGFEGTEDEWLNNLRYDHSEEFNELANKVYDYLNQSKELFNTFEETYNKDTKEFEELALLKNRELNETTDKLKEELNDIKEEFENTSKTSTEAIVSTKNETLEEIDEKSKTFDTTYENALNNINQKNIDFNSLSDTLTEKFNENYEEKKANVDEVKNEVDSAKQDIQDSIDDVAQEDTAQDILSKFNEVLELVKTIAENGSNAGSLNGFGFELLENGEVMMTYTDEETEKVSSSIFPTETTMQNILKSTDEMKDSVKKMAMEVE